MTREELTEALDRYGGDLGHWPVALRVDAEALIAADPDAADLAASVRRIEASLKTLTAPAPLPHSDVRRIVAGATRRRPSVPAPVRTNRLVAACSAAAVVAFFAAGFVAGLGARDNSADSALAALLFGASPIVTEQLL